MSNFEEIIPLILNKKFAQANELLEQRLYKKLGKTLEESLLEYAPSVFMNEIERDQYFTALDEAKKKMKKKPDEDGDGVPDWADKKPGEDDNEEDDKNNKAKKVIKAEESSKMDEDVDAFLNELTEIVEDIENELGEELTEEEIAEIAEQLISEEIDPDEDEEDLDDDGEFDDDDEEEICESCGE